MVCPKGISIYYCSPTLPCFHPSKQEKSCSRQVKVTSVKKHKVHISINLVCNCDWSWRRVESLKVASTLTGENYYGY